MKYTTHNSQIAVRRPGKLEVSCLGRRVWSFDFQ
jgi:hypothetical protein